MRVAFIGLVALAAPVSAQTDCYRDVLGNIHCRTQSTQPIDQGAILRSGQAAVPVYRAAPVDSGQMLRERVGRLVADHRCDEAKDTALKGGDFELVERVKSLCQ